MATSPARRPLGDEADRCEPTAFKRAWADMVRGRVLREGERRKRAGADAKRSRRKSEASPTTRSASTAEAGHVSENPRGPLGCWAYCRDPMRLDTLVSSPPNTLTVSGERVSQALSPESLRARARWPRPLSFSPLTRSRGKQPPSSTVTGLWRAHPLPPPAASRLAAPAYNTSTRRSELSLSAPVVVRGGG